MVASLDPREGPAFSFQGFRKIFPSDLLYTATSIIRSLSEAESSGSPASSQRAIASLKFSSISSIVSPWVQHPGNAGISAQKPPSSAL